MNGMPPTMEFSRPLGETPTFKVAKKSKGELKRLSKKISKSPQSTYDPYERLVIKNRANLESRRVGMTPSAKVFDNLRNSATNTVRDIGWKIGDTLNRRVPNNTLHQGQFGKVEETKATATNSSAKPRPYSGPSFGA